MITSARLTAGSGVADAFVEAFRRSMRSPEMAEETRTEDLFSAPSRNAEKRANPEMPPATKADTFVSGTERRTSGTILSTYA